MTSHDRPHHPTPEQSETVSQPMMKKMGRDLTSLAATGMFTGKTHSLLLSALTVKEIPHVKVLVAEADPKAPVVVMSSYEVLDFGFCRSERTNREVSHVTCD